MLMTNVKAHKLRSQFLKSYSVAQQAFKQMEADDVSLDPSTYVPDLNYRNLFYLTYMKYFKGATNCKLLNNVQIEKFCYINKLPPYKTFDASKPYPSWYLDDGQFILPDGILFMFENARKESNGGVVWVSVDINGYNNPPNRLGYDLFTFEFNDGELRTMGDLKTKYNDLEKYCNLKSKDHMNGIACAHRAKTETDYFKWVVKNVK